MLNQMMKVDAIRIDWNRALSIAEKNINKSDGMSLEERLKMCDAAMKITDMYRMDNIDGYFSLLDEFGDLLLER